MPVATLTLFVRIVPLLRLPPLCALHLLCIGRGRWLVVVNAAGVEYSLRIK